MNTEEIQRIAELIAAGTPALAIRAYAGASTYIRLLIDRLAIELGAEKERKAALSESIDGDGAGFDFGGP